VRSGTLFAALASGHLSPCQIPAAAPGNVSHAQTQAPPANRAANADEQSCREFVQNFYNWYWNRFADDANKPNFDSRREPDDWTVVKHKRSVLSPELYRLLADDEKRMKRTHELGSLDFDPFLNSQDPQGKYIVSQVKVAGSQCDATISQGHLVVEAAKSRSNWVFKNFRYSFYSEDGKTKELPKENLIQILRRKN
jgi:hypothetical protein